MRESASADGAERRGGFALGVGHVEEGVLGADGSPEDVHGAVDDVAGLGGIEAEGEAAVVGLGGVQAELREGTEAASGL